MRELSLNGYIDEEVWFGDEITPENLHEMLYEPGKDQSEDVHIRLNSYGGSCNAAVRMHDDLVAYPGKISITISGTAASAATVLAMGADQLEMTPGSLFMIHDPIVGAIGNEASLMDAIELLRACKESILNVYEKRSNVGRGMIAAMMRATTWMDAEAAVEHGFVDRIAEPNQFGVVTNCAVTRDAAEKKVQLWVDRHRQLLNSGRRETPDNAIIPEEEAIHEQPKPQPVPQVEAEEENTTPAAQATAAEEAPTQDIAGANAPAQPNAEPETGVPISQLRKRLALIMPREANH